MPVTVTWRPHKPEGSNGLLGTGNPYGNAENGIAEGYMYLSSKAAQELLDSFSFVLLQLLVSVEISWVAQFFLKPCSNSLQFLATAGGSVWFLLCSCLFGVSISASFLSSFSSSTAAEAGSVVLSSAWFFVPLALQSAALWFPALLPGRRPLSLCNVLTGGYGLVAMSIVLPWISSRVVRWTYKSLGRWPSGSLCLPRKAMGLAGIPW